MVREEFVLFYTEQGKASQKMRSLMRESKFDTFVECICADNPLVLKLLNKNGITELPIIFVTDSHGGRQEYAGKDCFLFFNELLKRQMMNSNRRVAFSHPEDRQNQETFPSMNMGSKLGRSVDPQQQISLNVSQDIRNSATNSLSGLTPIPEVPQKSFGIDPEDTRRTIENSENRVGFPAPSSSLMTPISDIGALPPANIPSPVQSQPRQQQEEDDDPSGMGVKIGGNAMAISEQIKSARENSSPKIPRQ